MTAHQAQPFANHRTVKMHVQRWRSRVAERLGDPARVRPIWDRQRFLDEWAADGLISARSAEDCADIFEAAIKNAFGNPARFRQELDRLLRE